MYLLMIKDKSGRKLFRSKMSLPNKFSEYIFPELVYLCHFCQTKDHSLTAGYTRRWLSC